MGHGSQNCLIFHPLFKALKLCSPNYIKVNSWRSAGTYAEKMELFDNTITTETKHSKEGRLHIKFNNSVLIQQKLTFKNKKKYLSSL